MGSLVVWPARARAHVSRVHGQHVGGGQELLVSQQLMPLTRRMHPLFALLSRAVSRA